MADNVQQLKEMFPEQSNSKITLALLNANQDLSMAIELLLSGVIEEDTVQSHLSPQQDSGKISPSQKSADSRKRSRSNDVQEHPFLKRWKEEIAPSSLPKFPSPFLDCVERVPYTLAELEALKFMGWIKEKRNWRQKLKDWEIEEKWRTTIVENTGSPETGDFVMQELQHEALISEKDSFYLSGVDGVYESRDLIPSVLHDKFISEVAKLEDVPESQRDWHPFSEEIVLDLVHPSLFCSVFGRSKVVSQKISLKDLEKTIGTGEVVTTSGKSTRWNSTKFQWLPSDVDVDKDGKVTFQSYINNLHPHEYSNLYQSISEILSCFIPMWEKTLAELVSPRPRRHSVDMYDLYESDYDGDYSDRPLKYEGTLEKFIPPPSPPLISLKNRKLQVIVKISEILLTPEKPDYGGGTWHVEGMENEGIVATAIYYWECENITESRLKFRHACEAPDYEQGDDQGVEAVYGLFNEEALNQELGGITAISQKCVTFPNIYQHQVSPFQLMDVTKPGKRKILVFFLVDPNRPILSTSVVPPQQKSWFSKEVTKSESLPIPDEIREKVVGYLDWPMTTEEAAAHRLELMEERKYFVDTTTSEVYEREFSLCEH